MSLKTLICDVMSHHSICFSRFLSWQHKKSLCLFQKDVAHVDLAPDTLLHQPSLLSRDPLAICMKFVLHTNRSIRTNLHLTVQSTCIDPGPQHRFPSQSMHAAAMIIRALAHIGIHAATADHRHCVSRYKRQNFNP